MLILELKTGGGELRQPVLLEAAKERRKDIRLVNTLFSIFVL